jgi:hypothetical protein
MALRVLFADDQFLSRDQLENESTRNEIKRELDKTDAQFEEDFGWFESLISYLKRKGVEIIGVRSWHKACAEIQNPANFDVAVIDLSWWGDASLDSGRSNRENVGRELIERLSKIRRDDGSMIPVIAYSQNFMTDFELMSDILNMGAVPVPKSYDQVGHRALYSAIQHLAKICRVSERPDATKGRVKLFISHAHRDSDIAQKLITALEQAMVVPDGAIRCTSVPGYKLDLGAMPADVLRRELVSARTIVAILTPHSLASQWVLFELGAAWLQVKQAIPLLAGNIRNQDLPGPLSNATTGRLGDADTLLKFLLQVRTTLGWQTKEATYQSAIRTLYQLAEDVSKKTYCENDVQQEVKASFTAKRARIDGGQNRILDYFVHNRGNHRQISLEYVLRDLKDMETTIYYRLEQLRYLGFLTREEDAKTPGDNPPLSIYTWRLSDKYKAEIG